MDSREVQQAPGVCLLHLCPLLVKFMHVDEFNIFICFILFSKVVAPFLLFLFTMPQESDKPVNLTLPNTPTKAQGTDGSKIGTPKTPATAQFDIASKGPGLLKNLHYGSSVLKKKGAEILYQLVTEEIDKDVIAETKGIFLDFVSTLHQSDI